MSCILNAMYINELVGTHIVFLVCDPLYYVYIYVMCVQYIFNVEHFVENCGMGCTQDSQRNILCMFNAYNIILFRKRFSTRCM